MVFRQVLHCVQASSTEPSHQSFNALSSISEFSCVTYMHILPVVTQLWLELNKVDLYIISTLKCSTNHAARSSSHFILLRLQPWHTFLENIWLRRRIGSTFDMFWVLTKSVTRSPWLMPFRGRLLYLWVLAKNGSTAGIDTWDHFIPKIYACTLEHHKV